MGAVEDGLAELRRSRFLARLKEKDPSLWKAEKKDQDSIRRGLGWLALRLLPALVLFPIGKVLAGYRDNALILPELVLESLFTLESLIDGTSNLFVRSACKAGDFLETIPCREQVLRRGHALEYSFVCFHV